MATYIANEWFKFIMYNLYMFFQRLGIGKIFLACITLFLGCPIWNLNNYEITENHLFSIDIITSSVSGFL